MAMLKCVLSFTEVNLSWIKLGQVRKIDVAKENCRPYCTIRVKGVDEDKISSGIVSVVLSPACLCKH